MATRYWSAGSPTWLHIRHCIRLTYDPLRDFVAGRAGLSIWLCVNGRPQDLPQTTWSASSAARKPSGLQFRLRRGRRRTGQHLCPPSHESAGVSFWKCPYKGLAGPFHTDLLAGRIDLFFVHRGGAALLHRGSEGASPCCRSKRSPAVAPEVPDHSEPAVPVAIDSLAGGIFAPPPNPAEVVALLRAYPRLAA